jgi:hypothetical protein
MKPYEGIGVPPLCCILFGDKPLGTKKYTQVPINWYVYHNIMEKARFEAKIGYDFAEPEPNLGSVLHCFPAR